MHLDSLLSSAGSLLYMERYVDEGTRTYSRFAARSEASPRYQPRSAAPTFELVAVRAPREDVTIVQADPQQSLLDAYVRGGDHDGGKVGPGG